MKTLTAYYDLAVGPVSFDFVVFAVKADMVRRERGLDRLHIVIVPDEKGVGGMFRDKTHLYTLEEKHWRLWNICIPACQLLRATVMLAPSRTEAFRVPYDSAWPVDWKHQILKDRKHLIGDIIEWSRAGQRVSVLRPSDYADRNVANLFKTYRKPVVTMTTRSTYMPQRNSNLNEWEAALRHIESKGYAAMHIADVSEALASGYGFAELNLDLRMACYENAALNLQENNGTASLCWFGSADYRMFGANNNPEEWAGLFVKQGLPLGSQWPWASEQQRLVYKTATADTLIAEFDEWHKAR